MKHSIVLIFSIFLCLVVVLIGKATYSFKLRETTNPQEEGLGVEKVLTYLTIYTPTNPYKIVSEVLLTPQEVFEFWKTFSKLPERLQLLSCETDVNGTMTLHLSMESLQELNPTEDPKGLFSLMGTMLQTVDASVEKRRVCLAVEEIQLVKSIWYLDRFLLASS